MIGYLIIIGLPVLFLLCLAAANSESHLDVLGKEGAGVSGILMLSAVILLVAFRIEYGAEIEAFQETRATVERARLAEGECMLESAAMQNKIIEANRDLRHAQYWYEHMRPFVPAKVMELEPIE